MAHGLQKTFGFFGGHGIEGMAKMLGQMNFNPPVFWAWVVGLSELLGGLFLVLGVIPRISAALIGIIMVVAIVKVHGPQGFFAMQGGFEYQLLILAVAVFLIITGSGKLSLFNKY
jgi:putative oxidoreductase